MTSSVPYQPPTRVELDTIETVYDSFGNPADPPVLLIAGLGAQMISWDEKFCAQLAGKGFRVIRFDNRDVGLATRIEDAGVPDIGRLVQTRLAGEMPGEQLPYTIYDMVDDTIALIDTLELDQVHVVGASFGGLIAQLLTIEHQDRVRTLTVNMSTTGAPHLPPGQPEALSVLMARAPNNRAEYVENAVQGWQVMYGSAYELDEEEARLRAARNYDRAYSPDGSTRQLAAGLALESLKPKLGAVTVPALVIHGDEDPIFPIECGWDIAVSVPGAKMLVLEGVGHVLSPAIWPQVIEAVADHAG